MKRIWTSRTPVLLAVLALFCYLPAIGWGIPRANGPGRAHAWGVDDVTPLGSLAEVSGMRRGPRPNRNLGYPIGHPLVVTAASAPYLGWLAATGGLRSDGTDYPLTDPVSGVRNLALIAHLVSVAFAIAVILGAWFAARELWGNTAGGIAGVMTATLFPMFYYARTGNVDMAQFGWMACALATFARVISSGLTLRRGVWLGLFAGAAVGTKEPIAAAFLAVPPVLLMLYWHERRKGLAPAGNFWLAALAATGAAALSFGIMSGLFLDSERYFAHLAFIRGRVSDAAQGNLAFVPLSPWTLDGHLGLARLLTGLIADTLTWPGFVLALAGVALAAYRRTKSAWIILPALTYLAVLFLGARMGMMRYVVPAAWVLALFAAYATVSAWKSPQAVVRWAGLAAATLMIALNLGRGLDLTHAMLADSRYDAAVWFAAHAQPTARISYFGSGQKIPPLGPDMRAEKAAEYRGAVVAARVDEEAAAAVIDRWKANPPDFIVIMPDHSSVPGVPYPASCPPSVAAALEAGTLGYQRAAFFESPTWLPWLRRPRLDYPTVNPPIRIYQRVPG